MIEQFRGDALFNYLLSNSSLTPVQLDTMLASKLGVGLEKKTSSRFNRKVSAGAFVRSLTQGQANATASIYTILLIEYVGFNEEGVLQQLPRIGTLLRMSRTQPRRVKMEELRRALENLVAVLSGRAKVMT